ncbi:hypothetical protein [Burkholderia sp. WSM2232]|uniref:hypothetical protein n=1 Tax=Burkholderia sp. WSM2232 TaxID=944436 RepID=UPI0018DE26DA|nr:hypothetical protein [Burkholderia sp. WSM2232]
MMEFFSPAVCSAILRVSSTPIFSVRLATASLFIRRERPRDPTSAVNRIANAREGASRA